jgi:Na+/melibiose symporter-like transporter
MGLVLLGLSLGFRLAKKMQSRTSVMSQKRILSMTKSALATCFLLILMVGLGTWQKLPVIGTQAAFWGVLIVLTIWLGYIILYRLLRYPKYHRQEQRLSLYQSYLPNSSSGHKISS